MAGGPTVNLLIAFGIFAVVFGTYGIKSVEPDAGRPVIDTVSRCVIPYAEEGRDCTKGDPSTPAGARPGRVTSSPPSTGPP